MALYLLCKTNEVSEGELKQFVINEVEILVIKRDGQIYCLEGRCTHAGAPLVEGELNDNILKCPWHGSRFNIKTGLVVNGPAKKQLRTYKFIVEEDRLLVDL